MALLAFISDENFLLEVERVIDVAIRAKQEASQGFGRNVIDPFAALFEMSGFGIEHNHWKDSEMVRQSQKHCKTTSAISINRCLAMYRVGKILVSDLKWI